LLCRYSILNFLQKYCSNKFKILGSFGAGVSPNYKLWLYGKVTLISPNNECRKETITADTPCLMHTVERNFTVRRSELTRSEHAINPVRVTEPIQPMEQILICLTQFLISG
jgi:hypothetical protein